ncbi:protein MALE DISCOVERER 2-like isoform X2 [Cornus florida]|uniref:protein MALE DISCOVERER 2-like isoform X2 n=1 Tax=Cornus florida TaxID=4283 RepID=UPI0028981599|nr:protein MALE DISCOVERER 2-like isoform X2 [Cornus florida]
MVYRAMRGGWNSVGIQLSYVALLILFLEIRGCWSLNSEGLALLKFRSGVDYDPYGAFMNWNSNDDDPCMWPGVYCVDGKVQMLDLKGLSLGGVVAPDLWKLTHLRSLVLYKNRFSGVIPKGIGGLRKLEVLDLRDNNMSGTIPAEIGGLQSLKRLLLCKNKFEGSIPLELGRLNLLSEMQFDKNLASAMAAGTGCVNRKFGHCLKKAYSYVIPIKRTRIRYLNVVPLFKFRKASFRHITIRSDYLKNSSELRMLQNVHNLFNIVRRRLLQQSSNIAAAPATASGGPPTEQIIALPSTRSSGAFPAVPNGKKGLPSAPSPPLTSNPDGDSSGSEKQPSAGGTSKTWKYVAVVFGVIILLVVAAAIFIVCRSQAAAIRPWRTGLSGQLQKAFVTGVPKLNWAELETACEDFSNIISTRQDYTIYKGTLSTGVEISVASTSVTSIKDWAKRSQVAYRKKIDTLARVNHKNFINLIGYCEEDEPFVRMMVFEYAPNGTLSEHLHVKEVEHLDWNTRMRIIMGIAYCLQYMHALNPPVAHTNLTSNAIYLTDDYAAKIVEIFFSKNTAAKSRISGENESGHSELPRPADLESNVYNFGLLLLEIISGKPPYSEEQGPLVDWAAEYLNDTRSIGYMIDPTLKSFKDDELDVICEVIQDCIQPDEGKRPTMKEIISKLREVIAISPDAATPRLSPLWWAELEILSAEAT